MLVEDHAELAAWVARSLRQAGFVLEVLGRGDHADQALRCERYDVVILDLSLPGLDGLEVLRRLRARESRPEGGPPTPVLVLTARGSTEERVEGLNLGADDYLTKPFELAELEARIKALLRRAGNQVPLVRLGRLEFDTTHRMARIDGQPLALTPRELAVLEVLLSRIGRPVAREALFQQVFEFDADARVEAIEIYVSRLRKKLEGAGVIINTLRGLGYLLSEQAAP